MLTLVAMFIALSSSLAHAVTIDLSLNVFYNNPASPSSGGAWQLVAKSDGQGLSGLKALVTGVATALNAAPRGIVNGSDPAGFAIFSNSSNPLGFNDITIGQQPITPEDLGLGEEQSVFYGVGTLANGAPNYPGKPAGSNSIGPAFSSLTNVTGVAWAASPDAFGDAAWNIAATLAVGTFAPGANPGFFSNDEFKSRGNTFTSLGNSTTFGNISDASIIASTIVRSNLMVTADYNQNGVVDTADYVLWRDTLGSTTALAADGNGNGTIDAGDYTVWRENFGVVVGSGGGAGLPGSAAVPEPATSALLAIGAIFAFRRARFSGRAHGRTYSRPPEHRQRAHT